MEIKDIIKEIDEVKQEHKLISSIYMNSTKRMDDVLEKCWSYKRRDDEIQKQKDEMSKAIILCNQYLKTEIYYKDKIKLYKNAFFWLILIFTISIFYLTYQITSLNSNFNKLNKNIAKNVSINSNQFQLINSTLINNEQFWYNKKNHKIYLRNKKNK